MCALHRLFREREGSLPFGSETDVPPFADLADRSDAARSREVRPSRRARQANGPQPAEVAELPAAVQPSRHRERAEVEHPACVLARPNRQRCLVHCPAQHLLERVQRRRLGRDGEVVVEPDRLEPPRALGAVDERDDVLRIEAPRLPGARDAALVPARQVDLEGVADGQAARRQLRERRLAGVLQVSIRQQSAELADRLDVREHGDRLAECWLIGGEHDRRRERRPEHLTEDHVGRGAVARRPRESFGVGDDHEQPCPIFGGEVGYRDGPQRERFLEKREGIDDPARAILVTDLYGIRLESHPSPGSGDHRVGRLA